MVGLGRERVDELERDAVRGAARLVRERKEHEPWAFDARR
jgi:hypothetical protein